MIHGHKKGAAIFVKDSRPFCYLDRYMDAEAMTSDGDLLDILNSENFIFIVLRLRSKCIILI